MKPNRPSIDRRASAIGRRRGVSMVELEVSFAAFAIILAGLCPVVVAELKHVARLESRFKASAADSSGFTAPAAGPPGVTYYYVVPRPEPWARKLAGTASVTTAASIVTPPTNPKVNTVTLLSAFAPTPTTEDPIVTVKVEANP